MKPSVMLTEVLTEEEDGSDVDDAQAALEDAAVTLEGEGEPSNIPTLEDVAVLLDYLRANLGNDVGADGKEFGQGVADLARDIHPGGDGGPPTSNPGQGQGNGNGNGQSEGGGSQGGGNGGSSSGDQAPGNSGTAPGRDADS